MKKMNFALSQKLRKFRNSCSENLIVWFNFYSGPGAADICHVDRDGKKIFGEQSGLFVANLPPFLLFLPTLSHLCQQSPATVEINISFVVLFPISLRLSFPFCSNTITCFKVPWNLQQNIDLGRLSSIDFYSLDLKSSPWKYSP